MRGKNKTPSRLALFLLLFVAGCGAPSEQVDNDNHGYGWQYDEIASSGLRVRYANDNPPRLATFENLYYTVATCMGIEVLPTGPLIIIKDGLISSAGHDAMTFLDTGTILLDSQITTLDWSPAAPVPAPPYAIKHEIVHYLLEQIGFPRDRNAAHDSPYFDSCGH